jgi:uncharacterized coiled-coil protein SlyX
MSEDPILKWRREAEEQAARVAAAKAARKSREVAAPAAWDAHFMRMARIVSLETARAIGEVTAEALAQRDETIDRLQRKLDKLDKLEVELTQQAGEVAKLHVKLAQDAVDRDRERHHEMPPLPRHRRTACRH